MDGVIEVEGSKDLAHVRREAHHILAQVEREVGVVVEEALVGELGGIVEGVSRSAAELTMAVLQALFFEIVLGFEDLLLGFLQRVVETPQHGEG